MKILCGAWGRQYCYSSDVRNVFGYVLQCSACVQKFIEFELIITELCSFMYIFIKPTYPTSDVTTFAESAVYILYIFANNVGTKRDSLLQ